jgi:thiosulfate/3-mercaptopyruvate sulfurtransferase
MTATERVIPHLVRSRELLAALHEPNLRVVDVRWRIGEPAAGKTMYTAGHIPGAVFADLDRDLAGTPGDLGRHPLPSPEAFGALMDRLGIGDDTRVVAYDDQSGAIAARLWFLLRYFGHETCAVLDGGIQTFVGAGHTLDAAAPPSSRNPPRFHAVPRPELVVDKAAVETCVRTGGSLLLDARAAERFRGAVEPIDARAGHIPTAVNAPFAGNLEDGRFLAPEALHARYAALGAFAKDTTVYCGSGVTACHDLLALALAGNTTAKLYVGSWSEWSRDPSAAIALGE